MFQLASFEEIAGVAHRIEILNPHLVARIRRAADQLNRHEIAAHLAGAITEAADAAHIRSFEEAQFGEASADAIVDCEYHDELAAAWSLVAAEHQLVCPDLLLSYDGSVH
ncbi:MULTISPECIES: hypothetical protein [Sphingobium]|uniref:Uncharacterized protein n=1 Tax=Sphingobium fuliginis (strain ATCC 27551) TaxID=336203 RepID=A0A292ZNL1_SPHSA|nr:MULTISPECIES: hypothetical protein [Sphingobium]OAP29827.1 hypothetical protein A8O16_21570 [Sphingobium sp. 20006FA]KXU30192.1 hypothetical protein AXW74_18975 [Sphingobium sp. AM]KYC30277.1 hypothetical protein A0J57_21370 [Sphingobium sp. 22B]MCB4861873.1 hypothetical protein [Sphingobium sp. PNB]MEC6701494.1 hypothetical protein [Sphingobium sp. SJ10-10]